MYSFGPIGKRLRTLWRRAMRPAHVIAAAAGALLGSAVGAMFDNIVHPGEITAIGAGVGAVVGLLALLRLHRCVPSASYWGT